VKLIVAIVRMIFHPLVNLGLLYSKGRAKGPNTKNKSRITLNGFKYHLTLPLSIFIEFPQSGDTENGMASWKG
jgi:hypothetical protein